jgi:hypothetical protein
MPLIRERSLNLNQANDSPTNHNFHFRKVFTFLMFRECATLFLFSGRTGMCASLSLMHADVSTDTGEKSKTFISNYYNFLTVNPF